MILHVRPIGLLTGISVEWLVGVLSAQDACKNHTYRKQKIRFALLFAPHIDGFCLGIMVPNMAHTSPQIDGVCLGFMVPSMEIINIVNKK